ncbi:malonate decarboxylase subunit epsilon [Pseudomonas sp. NPDC078700]|uniref:malonate decarboxylase subunit epsilon n=1 Tax=Pseudomonas sp. NPDC078700 TaxID=3364424 RepID=UPI0037CA3EAD
MSSLWVFPGQGAQQPEMLHGLPVSHETRECLAEASAVLEQDALTLDSAHALASTRAVQLCLLIAGVSCARILIQRGHRPDYVSGLSIGAYAAAVVAGALSFADALRLVSLRGELMQQAYPQGFGMTAIMGVDIGTLEGLLAQVNSPEQPVYLANINAEAQQVIAGSHGAMRQVALLAKKSGAGCAKLLAVSVPSHCPLLETPAARLSEAFSSVDLGPTQIRYLSSSSARLLNTPEQLRDDLANNMCRVVDWHNTLRMAYERGVRLHLELPPGTVLTGLARRQFEPGQAIAFQGARLDTLDAMLRQEASRDS